MSLLIALLIGIIVGGGGGYLLTRQVDVLFIHALCGIVGSILGLGAYVVLLSGDTAGVGLFSMVAILCSIVGASICVLVFNGLQTVVDNPDETRPKPAEKTEKEKIT